MITTSPARRLGRADLSFNSDHHHTDFAREAVFAEFRARDAKAILDANFIDRLPGEMPRLSPEAWR